MLEILLLPAITRKPAGFPRPCLRGRPYGASSRREADLDHPQHGVLLVQVLSSSHWLQFKHHHIVSNRDVFAVMLQKQNCAATKTGWRSHVWMACPKASQLAYCMSVTVWSHLIFCNLRDLSGNVTRHLLSPLNHGFSPTSCCKWQFGVFESVSHRKLVKFSQRACRFDP